MSINEGSLTSSALELLRQAGITVSSGTATDWTIRLPDQTHLRVNVKAFHRTPSPSWVLNHQTHYPEHRLMLVVRGASKHLQQHARSGSVDLIDMMTGDVIVEGREWATGPVAANPRRSSKPAWGRWGVMRALCISKVPLSQTVLAEQVGIAQSAVSQSLRNLDNVERLDDGWAAADRRSLLQAWRTSYVGPGGTSTYWYGLGDARSQAVAARELANELQIRHLLSGDVAADDYAPWRLPTTARLYVDELVDFTVINLTPSSEAEATLTATVPDDPTLWSIAAYLEEHPIAVDPMIVYWDLLHSAGADASEAAEKVAKAILS